MTFGLLSATLSHRVLCAVEDLIVGAVKELV